MVLGVSAQQSRDLSTLLKFLSSISAHGVEQTILYGLAAHFDRDDDLATRLPRSAAILFFDPISSLTTAIADSRTKAPTNRRRRSS